MSNFSLLICTVLFLKLKRLPIFGAKGALLAFELFLVGVYGLMLLQSGVVREDLEADLADVAGRLGVALPVLLELGEGGGHVRAAGTGQAHRVGLVVGQQLGHFTALVPALGALVRLAQQMLLLVKGMRIKINQYRKYVSG
jgi:hypothetical protein